MESKQGKIWAVVVMLLLVLITGSELARAWSGFQQGSDHPSSLPGNILVAVTLAGGQLYYGTLTGEQGGYLHLSNVYYVRNIQQQNGTGTSPQFNLVSKQKDDWHSPKWMAIPKDKVMYVENVGSQSRMGALIAQDRANTTPH